LEYLKDLDIGYDALITDIQSGNHQWSRGIDVIRMPWNHHTTDPRSSPSYDEIVSKAKQYVRSNVGKS